MGYLLQRDAVHTFSPIHQGGYCVRSAHNGRIALGECFEMDLDDIDMFIRLIGFKKVLSMRPAISRQTLRGTYRCATKQLTDAT